MPALPSTSCAWWRDVGGGFGSKTPQYNEEYLCLAGAKLTGRPVKWVGTRSEAFVSDAQAPVIVTHAEMALAADGTILAIRSRHVADLGAYAQIYGPLVRPSSTRPCCPASTRCPASTPR